MSKCELPGCKKDASCGYYCTEHHERICIRGDSRPDVVAEFTAGRIQKLETSNAALLVACKVALARHEQALAIRVRLTGITTGILADEIAQLKAAIALAKGAIS